MIVSHESPIPATFPTKTRMVADTQSKPATETHARGDTPIESLVDDWDAMATPVAQVASYFRIKPAVDRLIALLLMVVALPIMILVGLVVLIFSGWPIFYRQTRTGKNGTSFRIWKFRTMFRNAESKTGAVWSCVNDPRVTRLGRWLRCSHLDELPQLFNVIAGDMNLVGPRPERPEFIRDLAVEMPFYLDRLKVRPGITGLAQLRVGYDQSVAQLRQKILLDIEYIESTTHIQDLKLLVDTIPYIIRQVNANWQSTHTPQHGINSNPQTIVVRSSTAMDQPQTSPHDKIPKPHFPNVGAIAVPTNPTAPVGPYFFSSPNSTAISDEFVS